jgi:exopolyphosphatase
MKRSDINAHADIKWLLNSCQINQASLIFVDEIDLLYYDLFGSLKLILLNGAKLPTKQEALKEAVVEVFNCRKGENVYPWVQTVTFGEGSSCCTHVAEIFATTSPEILAGQAFSRLLLAGILLDTENTTNPDCSVKDKYMATLLINGAGRFGCNGLHQILKYKMHDVSELKIVDILGKDFKSWTRVIGKASRVMVSQIGMSSIGISIEQLLSHEEKSTSAIKYFHQLEKLQLLVIVSGYYDIHRNFKREILIASESMELMKNLLSFLNSNAHQLPLEVLHHPGLRENMRAFEIDKVASRRIVESLFEEFCRTSKY